LAALPADQQREVASTTDFSTSTSKEVKEKVKQIRQPAKKQELQYVSLKGKKLRRACLMEKFYKKELLRLTKAYTRTRWRPRVESVRFVYDAQGGLADVEIVQRKESDAIGGEAA